MTKDVLIAVSGLHFYEKGNNEKDETKLVIPGEYFLKNDTHYILYEEKDENNQVVMNRIKIKNDVIEITKRGELNVHMIFERGKKNLTNYQTPFGTLFLGLDTEKIQLEEAEDRLKIFIKYELEANHEHLAFCEISIDICSKEKGSELFRP